VNPNDTIRLLILNDSRDEAERLISMLRNAGRPSRAKHIESEEGLAKLLQEQTWDLLIAHDKTSNIEPPAAIRLIKRLDKDVPVILLSDEPGTHTVVEGLKLGACDVVTVDEDQHLLFVIQRELENRENRKRRHHSDRKLREAERRSQGLLDSSKNAIAYLQDGMFLYANESFGSLFEYQDKDDIECMTLVDLVAPDSQNDVKAFLKDFTLKGGEGENTELKFKGFTENQTEVDVNVEVTLAQYDDEVCIQLLSRGNFATNSSAPLTQSSAVTEKDSATGLPSRQQLLLALEDLINSDAIDNQNSSLLYIKFDRLYENVQAKMGISGTDQVLANIATLISDTCSADEYLARFADDAFILLAKNISGDQALTRASYIAALIENHIIDISGKTTQVTASIGISVMNESAKNAHTIIDQSIVAVAELGDTGDNAKVYEAPIIETAPEDRDLDELVQSAFDEQRFNLLFQPIISLRGSDEEHYEVLIRMRDNNNEQVEPKEFLNIAEHNKIIGKIDRWVVLESIKVLSQHRAKGNHTRLIINISSHSLCDKEFLPWLAVAFKAAELSGNAALFQITEIDTTNHMTAAKAFAEGLQAIGSGLALSHFGCSLNPFNTLKHVDASYVKVDGSFTLDIQNNDESPETLSNLVKELHQQSKVTIVPFVENASVLSTLWQAGVHYIQGHYLQAPTTSMDYDFGMDN